MSVHNWQNKARFKFGKKVFACVWGEQKTGVRKKKGRRSQWSKEKEPQKTSCKTSFKSSQSHFLQLYIPLRLPTQRAIFSSLFDQLLRLRNVPLKQEAPSGENDSQPAKGPPGWRNADLQSGVLTHHVTAVLASPGPASLKRLALAATKPSLSLVRQTCCTEENKVCMFRFGVSGLN